MKKIIVVTAILSTFTSKAQAQDVKLQLSEAGYQLQKYESLQYTGLALQFLGGVIAVVAANENKNGPMWAGLSLGTIGFGITLFSHHKIGKAGSILIGNSSTEPKLQIPLHLNKQ